MTIKLVARHSEFMTAILRSERTKSVLTHKIFCAKSGRTGSASALLTSGII